MLGVWGRHHSRCGTGVLHTRRGVHMSKLAIHGGKPVNSKRPLWPQYDKSEAAELMAVLRSRNWGGYPSPNTKAALFGDKFAKAHDAEYGVCMANGSVTLELALKAGGVKAGDEVIAPTYTWLATAACAVHINAVPVLVDVTPEDFTIDCDQVEAAIGPKTKAVIAVHLASSVADLDRLKAICRRHNLILIEDCAHAHGAKWEGKGVGSHGDFGSFSFQSSKLMTAGEGGAVTTNSKEFEMLLQSYVNCGRKEPGYDAFDGFVFGHNYRITEFQAGVLLAQLARLDQVTEQRAQGASYLESLLAQVEGISLIRRDPRVTRPAHYQYVFKYDPKGFKGVHRDRFLEAMACEGYAFHGHFYEPLQERDIFSPSLERYPLLKERYPQGIVASSVSTPVARKAAYEEAVWVHYPYISGSRKDIDRFVQAILKVQKHAEELL